MTGALHYTKLLFTTISWGMTFVAIKYLLDMLSPTFLAFIRFLATLIFLFLILSLKRLTSGQSFAVARPDLVKILLLGAVGVGLTRSCVNLGVHYSNASSGSLIMATSPIIAACLAVALRSEAFSPLGAAGVLMGFLGIIMILNPAELMKHIFQASLMGKLLLFAAATCWAFYSVLGKSLLRKYSPLLVTCYAMCGGVLVLLPFAADREQWARLAHLPALPWLSLIFLSLFAGAIGYLFWYDAIKRTDPSRVMIFMNVVPLSGTFFAVVLLHEKLSPFFLLGLALIVAGITLVVRCRNLVPEAAERK